MAQSAVTIDLGDRPEEVAISVSIAPYASVLALLVEAVAHKYRGMSRPLLGAIDKAVGESGSRALSPVGHPQFSMTPTCMFPVLPRQDVNFTTQIEVMRSMSEDAIADDISAEFGPTVPDHWREAMENPRQWLSEYADAAEATAKVLSTTWNRAKPMLDREMEAVGVAAVRGGTTALLDSISARITCKDGILSFPDVQPGSYDLDGRSIILVPIVSGPRMLMLDADSPDAIWIGYPIRGFGRIGERRKLPTDKTADRATLILGPTRAAILQYLSRPCSMSEAAADLYIAPGTLTFHCDQLEQADLIHRERHGRQVRLSRTARAEQLLDTLG